MLPTIIAEIGGRRLFAWATTLYLVGSVVAAAVVHPILQRIGARRSYLIGLTVFALASVVNVVAPSMAVLVAGRALRGVAGGLLAGLGYALINTALPRALWTRGSALVSAMWGVSTLIGPVAGGIFAQLGLWRWAYVAIGVAAGLMALVVLKVHEAQPGGLGRAEPGAAHPQCADMVAAADGFGRAGRKRRVASPLPDAEHGAAARRCAPGRCLRRRRRADAGSGVAAQRIWSRTVEVGLPVHVDSDGCRDGQYLCAVVRSEIGSPESGGGRVSCCSAGRRVDRQRDRQRVADQSASDQVHRRDGPVGDGNRLGAGRANSARARPARVCRAVGAGAADHRGRHRDRLATPCSACDGSGNDPVQRSAAAAAINTVQLVSAALGAGLAGVVVNVVGGAHVAAARWLYAVFAVVAATGVLASYRAVRDQR